MLSVLHSAKKTVDLCMHMVCSPALMNHLCYVAKQGSEERTNRVRIRLLVHEKYYCDWIAKYGELTFSSCPRTLENPLLSFTKTKFFIFIREK
jgi:hypothetical protein